MSVRYYGLGGQRRLHEIVFAGSHDASITSGSSKAQTQHLNIAQQADAGVRLFDLRILAHGDKHGASLVGYHGSKKGSNKADMYSSHTKSNSNVKTHSGMRVGTVGEKLSTMLKQAKGFVTTGDGVNEFLIFKFDKCTNWPLIAEYCVEILGSSMFKNSKGIEFSKLTLDDLKGKVVCVFNEKELNTIESSTNLSHRDGILGFRCLRDKKGRKKSYKTGQDRVRLLQYYGKGGTRWWNGRSKQTKINQNIAKQSKLMREAATDPSTGISPNVLGMMYWTTTGAFASIQSRNDVMWNKTGVNRMQNLWRGGLEAAIGHQLKQEQIRVLKWNGVPRMKAFFPNIIMVDFADVNKCSTIYELNKLKDDLLAKAYNSFTGVDA